MLCVSPPPCKSLLWAVCVICNHTCCCHHHGCYLWLCMLPPQCMLLLQAMCVAAATRCVATIAMHVVYGCACCLWPCALLLWAVCVASVGLVQLCNRKKKVSKKKKKKKQTHTKILGGLLFPCVCHHYWRLPTCKNCQH
jgi:hypothetical protein